MQFNQIGFRGDYIQIAPQHRLVADSNCFMLGTSYGDPSLIENLFDKCEQEYLAANQDFDVTSPFPKLTCLDGVSNKIYTTMLFLNDFVYSNYNKNSYTQGFEFLLIQKVNQKLYWSQIGWPQIFIVTDKLIMGLDYSLGQRSANPQEAPDLPHSLLGLHNSLNFRVESTSLRAGEELLFVKSQFIAPDFYHSSKLKNEELIKKIYQSNPKAGAWLGRLTFSDLAKAEDNIIQNL